MNVRTSRKVFGLSGVPPSDKHPPFKNSWSYIRNVKNRRSVSGLPKTPPKIPFFNGEGKQRKLPLHSTEQEMYNMSRLKQVNRMMSSFTFFSRYLEEASTSRLTVFDKPCETAPKSSVATKPRRTATAVKREIEEVSLRHSKYLEEVSEKARCHRLRVEGALVNKLMAEEQRLNHILKRTRNKLELRQSKFKESVWM